MTLSGEEIMKLTAEPYLYTRVPFLEPMRASALSLHKKFKTQEGKCKPCLQSAWAKVVPQVGAAFCRLIYEESKKEVNQLGALKSAMAIILDREVSEVVLSNTLQQQEKELRF